MLCGTGDCPASSEREPVCLRIRVQSWYTLWAPESLAEAAKQWAASFFNFNNILKGKKSLTKPPQPCKAGLNTTNTGSGEEFCCYSKELSTLCQQQDKILLRSVIFCSTFLTPDGVLVNINYIAVHSCFCGNILKQKFLVMKKEGNENEKKQQKYFYYFYFYKSTKSKPEEYFIKHEWECHKEYQNFPSGKKQCPSPFFLLSPVLPIKVLVPQASGGMVKGWAHNSRSWREKNVWQCLPPCSVLVQDQLRRLQPSPRPLHPPISKINEEILTNSKRLEHCLLLDLLVQRMTILPEWISFSSPRCHCQMASHAGRAARMWLEGRRMRGTQAPMCANQTGAMGQVLMPEFGEGV